MQRKVIRRKTGYYWLDIFGNEKDEGRYAGSVQNIDWKRESGRGNIFTRPKGVIRGHSLKLYKESHKKMFYNSASAIEWSIVGIEQVVNCESINSFKSNIDKFIIKNGGTL